MDGKHGRRTDYLRSVIIEDKLDLCDQLEQQMRYESTLSMRMETTIENESKLKRFRHFINSDQPDDNVVFVEERGQIRPADDDCRMRR
jgi:nitrite reductase (NADH) large subunit